MPRETSFPSRLVYLTSLVTDTVLRNFADILGPMDHTSELPLEEFQKVMAVNCTGVYLCTKHELRQMMKQDSIEVFVLPSVNTLLQREAKKKVCGADDTIGIARKGALSRETQSSTVHR